MSLASNDFSRSTAVGMALVAALSFGMASNANAAGANNYIEPQTADLSKPVDACVKSTPGDPEWTAAKKLDYILQAQGQIVAVIADKYGVDGKGGIGSTQYSVAKDLSGRGGYAIASSDPKSKKDTTDGYCLSPIKYAIAQPLGNPGVPNPVNKGDMGLRLTNQANEGSYTVVFGKYANGAIFAVHFNEKKNLGAEVISNGYGQKPGDTAIYRNLEVSKEFKSLLAAGPANKAPLNIAAAGRAVSPN